jgi:CHAT domain-containing protein
MKRGFTSNYIELVNGAVETLYTLGRSARAFEVAEQARARAFLDLLATRTIGAEASAELDIDRLDSLAVPADEPVLSSTISTRAATTAQVVALAQRLDSTVLAYWFNPNAAYIWIVRPDGRITCVRRRVGETRLAELIRRVESRNATDRQALQELYRYLIAPVRSQLPASGSRLTIVPHGPALRLSFAALMDERGRYLLEDYTLHYAPAMTAFDFIGRRHREGADVSARYLLAANPTKPLRMLDGRPLPPLAGSRLEVEKIAGQLPAGSARILTGRHIWPARNLVEPPVNGSCTFLSLTGRVGPLCRQAPCHTLAKQSACDAHR